MIDESIGISTSAWLFFQKNIDDFFILKQGFA